MSVLLMPRAGSGELVIRRWHEEGGRSSQRDPSKIGWSVEGHGSGETSEVGFSDQVKAFEEAGYTMCVEYGSWVSTWEPDPS